MAQNIVSSANELRVRINNFFSLATCREACGVIDLLMQVGNVGIFGGLPRDLSLLGIKGFSSDIDVVVDCRNSAIIINLLKDFSFQRTTLGGIRLTGMPWKVDVWPLQETWAIRQGLVTGTQLSDLVRTTFFDWDAVVYEWSTKNIYCDRAYFSRLQSGIVNINMEDNPNPLSMIVRTLRILESSKARIGLELAVYLLNRLRISNPFSICIAERRLYRASCLSARRIIRIYKQLELHLQNTPYQPFGTETIRQRFEANALVVASTTATS